MLLQYHGEHSGPSAKGATAMVIDRLRGYRFASSPSDAATPTPGLSWRELQVLALLVEGKENMEIAQALSISLQTVKRHISRILAKLTSPTALAAVEAVWCGLV